MPKKTREYWLRKLEKIARPALNRLAGGDPLSMLSVQGPRAKYANLELAARLLAGLAPWLESKGEGGEELLRRELSDLARAVLKAGVDPHSPALFNFNDGDQPLVDAAFLAQAILRAPGELWDKLDRGTRENLIRHFRSTRGIKPYFSNWLLFSALIEAFFYFAGSDYDEVRVDYALRQHEQWYLGDSIYSDGPFFHCDYYNSFVILPMLLEATEVFSGPRPDLKPLLDAVILRIQRHAVIQERLIAPDGSFPALGRSITYRLGAFHCLALAAWRRLLPPQLKSGQVCAALTAVMKRTLEAEGTFDEQGWLTIGLCGQQPALGEEYISVASTYLCTMGFLPLGLPVTDQFWQNCAAHYTAQRIWSGSQNVVRDEALQESNPVW